MASAADNGIWLGLLKWSLAHQDGTAPSAARPLSDQDRAFLEKVMQEGIRDDVKVMTECFEGLTQYLGGTPLADTSDASDAKVEALLEELQDITEQIDMANTFIKIGGPHCLLQAVEGRDCPPAVRAQAAACISAIAHNNVQSQDAFVKAGAVGALMARVTDASEPGPLRAKALGALSAVVRGHAVGELALRSDGGRQALAAALASDDVPLRRKATFLMKALVLSDDDAPPAALSTGGPCSAEALRPLLSTVLAALEAGEPDYVLREMDAQLLLAAAQRDSSHWSALANGSGSPGARLLAVARTQVATAAAAAAAAAAGDGSDGAEAAAEERQLWRDVEAAVLVAPAPAGGGGGGAGLEATAPVLALGPP